jgi:uncharacterized Zn finger protein
MSCERCGGLMVIETNCELMDRESRKGIDMARCVNCGNLEDVNIRTNRVMSRVPTQVESHTEGAGRSNTIQSRALAQPIHTERVMAEISRGRIPRLPVGTLSVNTRRRESSHIE